MRLSKLGKVAGKWFRILMHKLAEHYAYSYSQIEFCIDQFIGERMILNYSMKGLQIKIYPKGSRYALNLPTINPI